MSPATFFTLVIAADQQQTPRSVMLAALAEMEALGVADTILPSHPAKLEAPNVAERKNRRRQVQELKAQGSNRAEVAREIGCTWTTVNRLWNDEDAD